MRCLAAIVVCAVCSGQSAPVVPNTIYDHSEPVDLPELMRTSDGRAVSSVTDWESVRRPEILDFFTRNVYGERPVERPANLRFEPIGEDRVFPEMPAVRKRARISFSGPRGSWGFNACVFVPKGASADRPVPAFLLICNRALDRFADVDRGVKSDFFPVEEIVRRGYAAAVFKTTELALDDYHPSFAADGTAAIQDPPFTNGFYACWSPERTQHSWGAISAWAWGASRVLDWLETVPGVDAHRVAVVGHSRGGKTALWAGASDARFAMVCANDSGCCGAKLNHVAVSCSETIRQDNANNPHWFCRSFRKFNGRDFVLPYDQHWLAALVAPRLLYVASASEDAGAGPWGEFLTARHASPAWMLYGGKGLVEDHPHAIERPFHGGCVGCHLRKGGHDLTLYDWNGLMDFADRHLRWRWLEPPREYLGFERTAVLVSRRETPDYDIECYEQANGPGTRQRMMMVIPKGASGSKRLPAVVVPYYFVEGTIGKELDGTSLPHYTGVAFADELAKRGFVCITADAYHLSYLRSPRPRSDFGRWNEASDAFNRDWPEWSGIGKLAFDTRLLVDVLASDPRVDSGRIGIMGHSLGGKMAFYAGCTDPRIRVIVASDWGAGWDSTNWDAPWYWGERKLAELKSSGITHADLYRFGGRKPFLLIAGHDDTEASREMFAREGSRDFAFLNHATGHRPPCDAVEAGYGFLESRLRERRETPKADTIRLEGEYPGHLQDVWIDGGTIWWAHTQFLLKTGMDGRIVGKAEVGGHHAGLEVRDGRLYTAVCAFNGEPRGATTPACHVMIGEYDAATLDRIKMHVLDINDRAGSLCILEDGSFLVGCLRHPALKPTEVKFHHIGKDYRLIKTHVIDVGQPVKLGIEVIRRYGSDVYLLIYGGPLMRIDAKTFAVTGRFRNIGGQMGFAREEASAWIGFSRRKEKDDKASPWVSGLLDRPFALKPTDDANSDGR